MPKKSVNSDQKMGEDGERKHLQVTFSIEEQILWFDIPVSDTLAMKIGDSKEYLFEAAFDLTRTHASAKQD
jgi:hypothetical protein